MSVECVRVVELPVTPRRLWCHSEAHRLKTMKEVFDAPADGAKKAKVPVVVENEHPCGTIVEMFSGTERGLTGGVVHRKIG